MKFIFRILFLLSFKSSLLYSQNYNRDSTKIFEIEEVIISKNETSSFEKKLKVKWLLNEGEELVTYVPNRVNVDRSIKDIIFRLANLATTNNTITLKIYSVENDAPNKEIYSKQISVLPKDEINKFSFKEPNNLFKKNGIFIGFKFNKRDDNQGVYVFTESKNITKTYMKKDNVWKKFENENLFLPTKFRKIDLYLKIK